jgi:hypothetical protein
MNMAHGSKAGPSIPLTLALTFGANRVYLVGRQEAPLWIRQRGPWRRSLRVTWHRMDEVPGHWWVAQNGRDLVILGQGQRPPMVLREVRGGWRGLVPSGRQSIAVRLPRLGDYEFQPIRGVVKGAVHRSRPTGG